jgi:hypothetical protein
MDEGQESVAVQSIKVGDIVKARAWAAGHRICGPDNLGIVLDYYEDGAGTMHLEVQWSDRKEWWTPFELELVSECD